jgi:hypothetical protein
LRNAVEALPHHTKLGMLEGIRGNRVIVGAYTDKRGGVCPMLAAHRHGGRTDFGTFARAWDAFTGAKRTRRASARELRALTGYLESALIREGIAPPGHDGTITWADRPLADAVREIQAGRRRRAERAAREASDVTIEELLTLPQVTSAPCPERHRILPSSPSSSRSATARTRSETASTPSSPSTTRASAMRSSS